MSIRPRTRYLGALLIMFTMVPHSKAEMSSFTHLANELVDLRLRALERGVVCKLDHHASPQSRERVDRQRDSVYDPYVFCIGVSPGRNSGNEGELEHKNLIDMQSAALSQALSEHAKNLARTGRSEHGAILDVLNPQETLAMRLRQRGTMPQQVEVRLPEGGSLTQRAAIAAVGEALLIGPSRSALVPDASVELPTVGLRLRYAAPPSELPPGATVWAAAPVAPADLDSTLALLLGKSMTGPVWVALPPQRPGPGRPILLPDGGRLTFY